MMALLSVAKETGEDSEDLRHRFLVASVIQRAIVDWVLYRGTTDIRKRRLYHDADLWLFQDDRRIFDAYGITFLEACATLGARPEHIRNSIRSLSRERLASLRRAFCSKEE